MIYEKKQKNNFVKEFLNFMNNGVQTKGVNATKFFT